MQCGGASTNLEVAALKMPVARFFIQVLHLILTLFCVQIVDIGVVGPVPYLSSSQSDSVFPAILAESDVVLMEKSRVVQCVTVFETMFPIANNATVFMRHVDIVLNSVDTHLLQVVELQVVSALSVRDVYIYRQVGKHLFIRVKSTIFRVSATFTVQRSIRCVA